MRTASAVISLITILVPSDLVAAPRLKDISPQAPDRAHACSRGWRNFPGFWRQVCARRSIPWSKQTIHIFAMSRETIDSELIGLPDFAVSLRAVVKRNSSDTGHVGLKELKPPQESCIIEPRLDARDGRRIEELEREMKNLTSLDLRHTKTTDAGLKELKGLEGT